MALEAAIKTGKMLPYIPLKAVPTFYRGFRTTTSIKNRLGRLPDSSFVTGASDAIMNNPKTAAAGVGTLAATGLAALAYKKFKNRNKDNQKGGSLKWEAIKRIPSVMRGSYKAWQRIQPNSTLKSKNRFSSNRFRDIIQNFL